MDGTKMIVDYNVIDSAIAEIQTLLNDVSYTIMLGELNSLFEYSQSDYVEKLKSEASNLTEINNIVNDLLVKSKDMLYCAKRLYEDTDLSQKNSIENFYMNP